MSNDADHLCVLVHGLWGKPGHLGYVGDTLRERFPESVHILATTQNAGSFTYDGIELGGERVAHEIIEALERFEADGRPFKRISIVGYSLGGLLARYAIGLLEFKGWFDKIEPVNFTTFATPHLGVRSPLVGTPSYLYNAFGSRILSYSGRQLFMIDSHRDTGRPLLSVLADPSTAFMRGLGRFQRRSLYSNVINDRSAVFYTTFISCKDPFEGLAEGRVNVNYAPGFEEKGVIVDTHKPVSPGQRPSIGERVLSHVKWLPIYGILGVVVPVIMTSFLVSCGVQTVRSYGRMRAYQEGRATFGPDLYRLPLPRAVEVLYAKAGAATGAGNGHLIDDARSTDTVAAAQPNGRKSSSTEPRSSVSLKSSAQADGFAAYPDLALTPEQFEMIKQLDRLGWEKVPVHIQRVRHTHAAIIVRMKTTIRDFDEGKVVVQHWVERFQL